MAIQKLHVTSGKQDSKNICRRCLNCYARQNVLMSFKQRCDQQEKTAFKATKDSHQYWKKLFHKNPL